MLDFHTRVQERCEVSNLDSVSNTGHDGLYYVLYRVVGGLLKYEIYKTFASQLLRRFFNTLVALAHTLRLRIIISVVNN